MDELKKLLENAGVRENEMTPHPSEAQCQILDDLSDSYLFEIDDDGRIDVYTEFTGGEGTRRFATFDSFDHMLHNFGKL